MKVSKIQERAAALLPEVISMRRHLHMYPELSFEEVNTSAFIAARLKEYGIPFRAGIVKTGIVAILEGKNPARRTIALRGDMDALPITEKNQKEYCSKNVGVMHACGHDVHTASLLGVAKILSELRSEFEGTVKLIFQPGEEKLPGGASLMIKAGVLEDPTPAAIFGQHVFPSLEAGQVGFRGGMYMASTDELYVTVKGKGGHAAMPAEYNNPIYIASQVLLELNAQFMGKDSALRKKYFADIPTVLAFGKFIAEGATNVIPAEVKIEGTFRTMDEKWRTEAHHIMKAIAEDKAKELGGICQFNIEHGYPFLVNDEKITSRARAAAEEYLGKENVVLLEKRMTAEDFAFYTHHVPGCFYRLGTGNKAKGITSGVHTATFDIDEKALETGMGLMAWLALEELKAGS
jgi:amidohydrolase